MEATQPDGTFTFACRSCNSPITVGPQNRSYQFYMVRCGNCGLRVEHPLPAIRKKIIYLDQFVLSNILAEKEDRWKQVYKRLQWLNYLQVAVCPYSEIHHDESLVADHSHDDLKELYRELSHGLSFADLYWIEQHQLRRSLRRFLQAESDNEEEIRYSEYLKNDPNRWELDMQVYADFPRNPHFVSRLKNRQGAVQRALDDEADQWRQEKGRRFVEDVEREAVEYARSLMGIYREFDESQEQIASLLPDDLASVYRHFSGNGTFNPQIPPSNKSGALLVHGLACEVRNVRPDEADPVAVVGEFLHSDEAMKGTPFLAITSRLRAVMAQQARNEKGPHNPKASDENDIALIAHFAPYCDAMVVDNKFRALATQGNVGVERDYDVRLFSARTLDDFIAYLDDLLANIPLDHRKAVKAVIPNVSQLLILKTD